MKVKKSLLLIVIIFSSYMLLSNMNFNSSPVVDPLQLDTPLESQGIQSSSAQWIQNPTMTSPIEPTWYSMMSGDLTDIDVLDGQGQGNVTVIGDNGVAAYVYDPPSTGWISSADPEFPATPNNGYGIDGSGMYASHTWDEDVSQLGQVSAIRWKRNVTTPVNMTDYEIISASLTANCSATVSLDIDVSGDSQHGGSGGNWQFQVGDYIRYYVKISDLSGTTEYEVAYYKTSTLGSGNPPGVDVLGETLMVSVPEAVLIPYLTSVLEEDYHNFTITVGIFIFSEDNSNTYDLDTYTTLRVDSVNLTFSYEKKILRNTYASWNQQGPALPQGNVVVDAAQLYFKYRLESGQTWPSTRSPNSEIRMQINNITHSETVKLSDANSTYQEGKAGGFDVSSIIPKSANITVSIQIYLADNFNLPSNITISVDDVYLWINYTIYYYEPSLNVVANTTYLYNDEWTQLTVTCENTSSDNIDWLGYYDPFLTDNVTLDTSFSGLRTYLLNFSSSTSGPREFKVYANTTAGEWAYDDITVVWVTPIAPSLSVSTNATTLFANQWAQLTVTCENGSGLIDTLWYYDPFLTDNVTLAEDFTGTRVELLNFTSASPGTYTFRFWANTTYGKRDYDDVTVIWEPPLAPSLSVAANVTDPYINEWTQLTVTCQSGTGNVSVLWYNNPFDNQNYTLDFNFAGIRTYYLNYTSGTAGPRTFKFWANSTLQKETYRDFYIVWVGLQAPILSVVANTTDPFIDQWTQFSVTCVSGAGNVSVLKYYNPLDSKNHTLATNFAGTQNFLLNFTSASSGAYLFQFWANSTYHLETYRDMTIFWKEPTPPTVNVIANTTSLFVNYWVELTVSCQSGSDNISMLWYRNPFDGLNYSIDNDFSGLRIHYLDFSSASAGSYEFRFWANSTSSLLTDYDSITIVWINPTPPSLSVVANITDPFVNDWTELTVTCQSGSGNVSSLWYYSPMDQKNHTLATNFAGTSVHTLDFMNATAGTYKFQFWALSALGVLVYDDITIIWVTPTPPILSVDANWTLLDIHLWTQLTVTCQSGSLNVSTLWYRNPFDGINYSLAEDYTGSVAKYLNFSSASTGSFEFRFWANSTRGTTVYRSITVVWVSPTAPSLDVVANTTILTITYWTQLIVTCQSGSGNIDTLWMRDPFTGYNETVDTDFAGLRTYYLNYTDTSAGARTFEFWTNSTLGTEVYDLITIVWTLPTPPSLSVATNATSLYTTQVAQLTVSCQSGSDDVDTLWYNDPFDGENKSIATDFSGLQIFTLNFTSLTPVSHTFRFWANATLGMLDYDSVIVVWITPLPPSLSVIANITNPYTDAGVQLTVSCQKGSINVSHLYYTNPFDGHNYTVATDFVTTTNYLDFISTNPGVFEFKFYANDTLGFLASDSVDIVWVAPFPPTINLIANITDLYTTYWVSIRVDCQSGSEDVLYLWYENPFDNQTSVLAMNFNSYTTWLNFTSAVAGQFEFEFWANSSVGPDAYETIEIDWKAPDPPILLVDANTTLLHTGETVLITLDVTSGAGYVTAIIYENPFNGRNTTLPGPFVGNIVIPLYFTNATEGTYKFKAWAIPSLGAVAYDEISVSWVEEAGPAPFPWGPVIGGLIGALAAVTAAFLAYTLYFSVPKNIRTIRKTKANIRKGKVDKPVDVAPREELAHDMMAKKIKTSKLGIEVTKKPEAPAVKVTKGKG